MTEPICSWEGCETEAEYMQVVSTCGTFDYLCNTHWETDCP